MFSKGKFKFFSNKKTALFLLFLIIAVFLLSSSIVFAQEGTAMQEGLQTVGEEAGLQTTPLPVLIGRIIGIVLAFLGTILLGIIIYAGILWSTAGGDSEKVKKAQLWIRNGVIGLLICLASYAITSFIVKQLTGQGLWSGLTGQDGPPAFMISTGGFNTSALGSILVGHYPERDASNVPRNTAIMLTFREEMDAADLISSEKINSNNIKIFLRSDSPDPQNGEPPANQDQLLRFFDARTPDNKTFIFTLPQDPPRLLGSDTEDVQYMVWLSKEIKKQNGDLAFPPADPEYYWQFQTNTDVDVTPPRVQSVFPIVQDYSPSGAAGKAFARNVVIQINFNEPVIPPLDLSYGPGEGADKWVKIGTCSDFSCSDYSETEIEGYLAVGSNRYRTIEFITRGECGSQAGVLRNSCGDLVYCLPAEKFIRVAAKAAITYIEDSNFGELETGIVDAALNSLDGQAGPLDDAQPDGSGLPDGVSQGPGDLGNPQDDYPWMFLTSEEIKLAAPVIVNHSDPGSLYDAANPTDMAQFTTPVYATFNEPLQAGYIYNASIRANYDWGKWTQAALDNDNLYEGNKTLIILHGPFDPSVDSLGNFDELNRREFYPVLNSQIRDVYNNCFTPCQDNEDCPSTAQDNSCCATADLEGQEVRDALSCE